MGIQKSHYVADLAEIRSRGYTVTIEGDAAPGALIQ